MWGGRTRVSALGKVASAPHLYKGEEMPREDAHFTPPTVVAAGGVPMVTTQDPTAPKKSKKTKKEKRAERVRDAEFLILFDDLAKELAIVSGHERKITKIRERMQEIIRKRDA